MKKLLSAIIHVILFVLLTFLTQIGGIVWLISVLLHPIVARRLKFPAGMVKFFVFVVLYLFFTFALVPVLAKPFGRVPLPLFSENHIRPVSVWTCILNRNYVRPELKRVLETVAGNMAGQFADTEIRYLDASLPFMNGFPLLPHLSHNDGCKLDLAYFYTDRKTGKPTNLQPAFSGYGVFEGPRTGENNTTEMCLEKGYWQYDYSKYLTLGSDPEKYVFDEVRTRAMIGLFAAQASVQKMFLEPHLKSRMGLNAIEKIGFQGCRAVRHDDHLHIQMRD